MARKEQELTPMLRQYLEIKEKYQDCILFYRMGDFYEMFYEDAVRASMLLDITLTTRDRKKENPVPMCGIPFHAAEGYIVRLVRAGEKVAICEQTEDPRKAKGIVRREVVRVVTPGLISLAGGLDARENNYLAAISPDRSGSGFGFAFVDISTGEFRTTWFREQRELLGEVFRIESRELLLPDSFRDSELVSGLLQTFSNLFISYRPESWFRFERAEQILKDHFGVITLDGFGLALQEDRPRNREKVQDNSLSVASAGALLKYCMETQKGDLSHISALLPYRINDYLMIDECTKRHLELVQNSLDGTASRTLLSVIDHTTTAMGARLLKRWLLYPLMDQKAIEARLDAVEFYLKNEKLRNDVRRILKGVHDLERVLGRVILGNANARDLTSLKKSLSVVPSLNHLYEGIPDEKKWEEETASAIMAASGPEEDGDGFVQKSGDNDNLPSMLQRLLLDMNRLSGLLQPLVTLIHRAVREDAPLTLRDGKLIRKGFNPELDELIEIQQGGRSFIAGIESNERERTGISSLKVGYNKVFGYYIEIPKSKVGEVPDEYIRKQTLVNAERYITPELKEIEARILTAQERRLQIEYEIFQEISGKVAEERLTIQKIANILATMDCLVSLAETAFENRYTRPVLSEGFDLEIKGGRHPVVEKTLAEAFVPNDISFTREDSVLILITGPNMAGKSTILRQTALIVIMAQMGCFVPAESAVIPVTDQIFTRVGATDYLSRGQSTFMVEMSETANILNNATPQSLVILDEIGRGTSTHDGLAIAWAVAEYLLSMGAGDDGRGEKGGVKTLFATHYHELTALEKRDARVKNMHVEVQEFQGSIAFLHTLKQGGTSKSYGIQVAALAGVPRPVVERANDILSEINRNVGRGKMVPAASGDDIGTKVIVQKALPMVVERDGGLRKRLKDIDLDNITPLQALNILAELKQDALGGKTSGQVKRPGRNR